MHYRSQLDVDYKQSSHHKSPKQTHRPLAILSVIVLLVMGVVIANVNIPENVAPIEVTNIKTELPQAKIEETEIQTIALNLEPRTNEH